MQKPAPTLCARCGAALSEQEEASARAIPDFTPVPRKHRRRDGWTPERQRDFIRALAATGSVTHAARAVNMAKEGAYTLRSHPEGASFDAAWKKVLGNGAAILVDATMERAIHGVPVPIFYKGQQVGERRVYNDRLAMFHMRHRLPETYGPLVPPGRGTVGERRRDIEAREKAREEAERRRREEEEEIDPAEYQRRKEDMARFIVNYSNRVQWERECRRRGDIEEADFYSRQLTHIEVLIEIGNWTKELMDVANRYVDPEKPWERPVEVCSTPFTDLLAQMRREGWERAEKGEPPRHITNLVDIDRWCAGGEG